MEIMRWKSSFIILSILSLGILVLLPPFLWAQGGSCGLPNQAYRSGEQLRFKVYYNMGSIWIGAGTAEFRTTRVRLKGQDVLHICATGQTYSSYDWIYKVRDRYDTWIDPKLMLPVRFSRNIREGSRTLSETVDFDRMENMAFVNGKQYPIPKCTQDVLSSIFHARNIDFDQYEPGEKIPFTMFLDGEVFQLYIRYLGKETITTKFGTFKTYKIRPKLIEGTIFKGGEDMVVWVTQDRNKVPVRVSSPILVGSVKVDLVGYENLRHPFTGLIRLN